MSTLGNLEVVEAVAGKVASDPNETREDYIKRKISEGFAIEFPMDNELQVDIDNEFHYAAFERSFAILSREIEGISYEESLSSSGLPCRHIRIYLPWKLETKERIMWQAALGSDPVRELLSALRAHRGDIQPTLFAEKREVTADDIL